LSKAFAAAKALARGLQCPHHHSLELEVRISVDAFEGFARLASAVSLLALYKIGRGSGWHRSRQRAAGERALRKPGSSSPRGSSSAPGPAPESKPGPLRLHAIVAGLWIVLSLALLSYATIQGELALADLDGLELLTTYSWSPLDRP
jgi:hypothetical protein